MVQLLVADVNSTESDRDEWILDTGCSFHMTLRRNLFLDMKNTAGGRVCMENNTITEVKGVGSV